MVAWPEQVRDHNFLNGSVANTFSLVGGNAATPPYVAYPDAGYDEYFHTFGGDPPWAYAPTSTTDDSRYYGMAEELAGPTAYTSFEFLGTQQIVWPPAVNISLKFDGNVGTPISGSIYDPYYPDPYWIVRVQLNSWNVVPGQSYYASTNWVHIELNHTATDGVWWNFQIPMIVNTTTPGTWDYAETVGVSRVYYNAAPSIENTLQDLQDKFTAGDLQLVVYADARYDRGGSPGSYVKVANLGLLDSTEAPPYLDGGLLEKRRKFWRPNPGW